MPSSLTEPSAPLPTEPADSGLPPLPLRPPEPADSDEPAAEPDADEPAAEPDMSRRGVDLLEHPDLA